MNGNRRNNGNAFNSQCSGVALGALFALVSMQTLAHHGDAGRYEETITTLSGTVVTLQLINPHSSVVLDVADDSGQLVRWRAEFSNATGLARIGWTRDTLQPGDRITISGRRVKSGAPRINLSERARMLKVETCEEVYRSGMIFGDPPDYPAPACEL